MPFRSSTVLESWRLSKRRWTEMAVPALFITEVALYVYCSLYRTVCTATVPS